MDTWIYLSQGFAVAMTPENLVIALIGCFVGTIVGLLPGLGPINGVAILLPLAFALHLPAESALILLATVYIGCEYGGRISSILLNVPGDAAAIMTALDGYPMAQQGRGAGDGLRDAEEASGCMLRLHKYVAKKSGACAVLRISRPIALGHNPPHDVSPSAHFACLACRATPGFCPRR